MTESEYMGIVAQLPCACCSSPPQSSVHHVRTWQGMSQRASGYLTVALCWDCHQGPGGVHGDQSLMRIFKTSEQQMLAKTIAAVAEHLEMQYA